METSKVHIFIQARSGSTRFPKKVMQPFGKSTVVETLFMAARAVCPSPRTKILIPDGDTDLLNEMSDLASSETLQGPEEDVLSRFVYAADYCDAKYIMRLTADCPMLPSSMIRGFIESAPDPLVYHMNRNDLFGKYPVADGFDMELFSLGMLDYCNLVISEPSDRQHVCAAYLKYADKKYSVDTPEDLERVRKIYEQRVLAKISV